MFFSGFRKLKAQKIFKTYGEIVLFANCSVWYVRALSYANSTQSTLCAAQCEALCLDNVTNCEQKCLGSRHWMADCDVSNCTGTCTTLYLHHNAHREHLLHVPDISLNRTGPGNISLTWNVPTELSTNSSSTAIVYIVEETHTDPRWSGIRSVALKWVKETYYNIQLNNICNTDSYRVMAVNQFGSFGFSSPAKIPDMKPGPVQNIGYTGNGVYYYINKNNTSQSRFMAVLEWDPPAGWLDLDIDHYYWNPMVRRYCRDASKDSLPIFTTMQHQSRHVLMTIGNNSIDCVFTAEVQAVSKCNVTGPWAKFKVDLRDCHAIIGYKCDTTASDPPGRIDNVTLDVSSTPVDQVLQMFANPYSVNNGTQSPLLINLNIHWQPPADKGSQGVIDHFTIRHGPAERNFNPLPPSFIGEPHMINVAQNIHELGLQLPTQNIPYTYGVQVVAVGPGQVIQKNDWGLYDVRTIVVSRNDSGIGTFIHEGKVLLDKAGLVIVYVDNFVNVQFMFDQPMGHMDNSSIDRLALQWGPLVGPDKMQVENRTVVPLNQSSLSVTLQHPGRSYGVKAMYLAEDEENPMMEKWDEVPIMSFTVPHITDDDRNDTVVVETIAVPIEQLTPLYITVGVTVVILLTAFTLRCLLHRRHFKHLERRLAVVDDDVSEDGEHYFVMRPSNHSLDEDAGIPTVVADQWELPHCCLKMGCVLGSGAFGQVVKGRVSKTMLMHRGIGSHTVQNCIGTHLTVAIKMLQDNADDRHTENFLKEIDMMKDIGYHRNIVSILGCCTLRQPYCLVVEHMPHGDLLAFFRNIRHTIHERTASGDGYINQDTDMFSPRDLVSVARQITAGMEFLSQKGFVHRDLAARNVLVGDNKTVKIGDFGLARYIYHDTNRIYVTRRGGKLPLRWMSPEAIFSMTFSTASDIWSFGIVLYEIVTLGGAPYPTLSNIELLQALKQGYRMKRPDNCSQEIYSIMLDCWKETPDGRPSFTDLCKIFTSMLEEDAYLEYFNFDVPLEHDYYRINSDNMDTDILDLDDHGIPTSFEKLSGSPGNRPDENEIAGPSQKLMVTTEISEKNCTIVEISKTVLQEETTSYTDEAFIRRRHTASVSSFDNGLYSTMENKHENDQLNVSLELNQEEYDGTVPSLTSASNVSDLFQGKMVGDLVDNTEILPRRLIKPIVEDRTSNSSDDVFTFCPGCTRLNADRKLNAADRSGCSRLYTIVDDTDLMHCPDCGRMDIHLSSYDLHVNERNDSAICSTASDDSDHSQGSNQSESSMAISDVYLMPDSPIILSPTINKDEKLSHMKAMNTFNFNQSSTSISTISQLGMKGSWLSDVSSTAGECIGSLGCFDDHTLQDKTGIDQFLLGQGKSDSDIWFICETKF